MDGEPQPPPGGGQRLKPDAIVDALVPDACEPPDVTVLSGFVGMGTAEGTWRVYLTLTFDEYVIVREQDILYAQQFPDGAPTRIWVPSTAMLEHRVNSSRQLRAEFLEGPMADGMGRAQAYLPMQGGCR